MEAKSEQEDYQSKLARDVYNFHYCGCNRVNAYGGTNNGNGNFTPKRHNGFGSFSSCAKSYRHTSYDNYGGYDIDDAKYDYYEHSPYDCYEEYHHIYGFDKGRSMEKEFGTVLEELPISSFLIPSLMILVPDLHLGWIHLKRGAIPRWCGPIGSPGRYPRNLSPGLASDMGERLLWNRALIWCLAGIDYEMPELGSDDCVLGSRP
ncbi:hypothetical protein M9H77_13075 [Catharanthus roseus]|uniref:Uncharacterized protein n=1 Tax=Catharanthus roseus TaxID=4058 RepID=A0ACC0BJI2_CATRO|nr:hypothetical protein M9H77_13075 [Catharanthus roseus]